MESTENADLASHRANSTSIITSLSNGNLAHIVTDDNGSMTVDHTWHAHDYEPWITAWDLWQPDTVWSGVFTDIARNSPCVRPDDCVVYLRWR